jgi:hypothetical protein
LRSQSRQPLIQWHAGRRVEPGCLLSSRKLRFQFVDVRELLLQQPNRLLDFVLCHRLPFLRALMAERIEVSDLEEWARKAGVSKRTLERARKKLGVVSKREGFGTGGKFYLSLPQSGPIERHD